MQSIRRRVGALLFVMFALGGAMVLPVAAQFDEGEVPANVILCSDPDCANTVNLDTMLGATVLSYDAAGTLIDQCTVSLTAGDRVDCWIVPAPEGGAYDVTPPSGYEGHRLLTTVPEVFESEMRGPVYVWYFAPEQSAVTPVPTAPAPPAEQPAEAPAAPAPVTNLPSTGAGGAGESGILAVGAFGIGALAMLAGGLRRGSRS